MNKIFKVVWSKTKNAYVVVSEVAKSSGKSSVKSRVGRASLAATLAVSFMLSAGIMSAEAAVTEVPVVKWDGSTYYHHNLQGTNDSVSQSKTANDRVFGGWGGSYVEGMEGAFSGSLTVNGGNWDYIIGGNYADQVETPNEVKVNIEKTEVVINDGVYAKHVVGGTAGHQVNKYTTGNADRTAHLVINGGSFGNAALWSGNTLENLVVGGDHIKGYPTGATYDNATDLKLKSTLTEIKGGTFDSLIIGGSLANQYYAAIGSGVIKTTVDKAETIITGGTFNQAIVAGGVAIGGEAISNVGEAILSVSNATVNSDIYTGGMVRYVDQNGAEGAEVGKSTVTIENSTVKNVYGVRGYGDINGGWKFMPEDDKYPNGSSAEGFGTHPTTDLTIEDSNITGEVDIRKGSIALKGDNTIGSLLAGADATVDVSGNADVDTLQVEQKELNFNGDGVLDIAKSVTKDMTYTADDGVTDATVVYNNPQADKTNIVIEGETITLEGVNLEVNSDYDKAAYSGGVIKNTTINSDSTVTLNQNGEDHVLSQGTNKIKADTISLNAAAGAAIYLHGDDSATLEAKTITMNSNFTQDMVSYNGSAAGVYSAGGTVDITGFDSLTINVTSDVEGEGGHGIIANGSVVDVVGSENSIITVDSVGRGALVALSAGELNIETKDLTAGTTALEGGNEVRKNSTLGAQGIGSAVNITATGAVTLTAEEGMNAIGADTGASVAVDAAGNVNIEGQIEGSGANGNRAEISVAGNDISVDTAGEDAVRGFLSNITINAEDELNITSRDKDAIQSVVSKVELNAKTVNLTAGYDGWGINATGDAGNDITVNAENVNVVGELGGIQNLAKSTIEVNTDNIMIDAGENEALRAVNNGMIEVNAAKSAAVTGDVTASTGGSVTAEFNSATSYLVGNVTTDDASQTNLTFGKGAVWTTRDSGASSVTALTVDGGTINQNSTDDITIGNYSGQGNVVFKNESAGDVIVKNAASGAAVQLSMASVTADDIQSTGDLNDIANKLEATQDTKAALSTSVYVTGGLLNNEINADVIYEDVDGDGLFNAHIAQMTQSSKPTTTVTAVSGIAANAAVAWRDEDATFSQRLGELRESEGDQGVWARFTQGEFERGNDFETEYNMFQIGYDRAKGDWHYGVAVSHNEGDTTYSAGSGEFSSTSFSAYGTWLGSKGHYKDLVAKIGVIDNEYTVSAAGQLTKGDYDTVGTSLSAEYGMKNDMGDGWFVTPLAKMTYMHIGAADYTTNNGISVKHKSVDSLIARLGVELGKQLGKKGDVYVKASALHDFGGDADTVLRLGSNRASITDEIGGTWYEVGLGFNYKTSDATYLYADVIKTYGDEIRTPWQWNIGARYSF